jgi:hypothetical protein
MSVAVAVGTPEEAFQRRSPALREPKITTV